MDFVVFSPDDKYLATISSSPRENIVRILKATSDKEITRMNYEYPVKAVTFSRDGKYLATASRKTINLWEIKSGKEVARMNHENAVISVAFRADVKYMITASEDNTIHSWLFRG